MIIFVSSSASSISEHLRWSMSKGFLGFYDSKDERAVFQAAALAGRKVLVVKIWLIRLSLPGFVLSSVLRLQNQWVTVFQFIFWMGVLLGFVVISLDIISPKQFLKK